MEERLRFSNYFKNRRLQVDILTIFLLLIFFSSVAIISFTRVRSTQSILKLSKETIDNVSASILERLNCMANDAQRLVKAGAGLFLKEANVSEENKELVSYMLGVIKSYPNIDGFYVGTREGNDLGAEKLSLTNQIHFLTDPAKKLPKEAVYGFVVVNRTGPHPQETWFYKNEKLVTVAQEVLPQITEDPRTRPWYIGAKECNDLFWSDVYVFYPSKSQGISVSQPVFNEKGELIAVVGADLSFALLGQFLTEQEIGNTGKAFILDSSGRIVVAPQLTEGEGITQKDAEEAFARYRAHHLRNFTFKKNKVEYAASVNSLPIAPNKEWSVLIMVPLVDFFEDMEKTQREVTLISLLILVIAALLAIYFSKRVSTPIVRLAEEVDKIKQLNFDSDISIKSNIKEIKMMSSSVASLRAAIRSFGRYVPKEIVNQLIRKGKEIKLGGEKKEVAIFFSDISGFTTIAETTPPDILMTILSQYFDGLSKIILETQGTIDKYIGDNIMAFWGAPLDVPDYAGKACKAALLCQSFLLDFNKKEKEKGNPAFPTRIGIHDGTVIVGNIGTKERMNYSIIGNAVSEAFSLQELNKIFRTKIVVSEAVYQKTAGRFLVRPLDVVNLKGGEEKMTIYELVAMNDGPPSILAKQDEIELCKAFSEAYEAFRSGKYSEAKELFTAILNRYPDDYPTRLYLEKTVKYV